MTLLVIENYQDTDLGILGREAKAAGLGTEIVKAHIGDPLPNDIKVFRGLVVLGGGQNALADDAYPHLPEVCDLIRTFHEQQRPVMGICLGSQLIARAFGSNNVLGLPVEFGWHDVMPTAEGRSDPVLRELGESAPQFHWHTDTVSLPAGAIHLAESSMTRVQAFRIGKTTYAVQFHFETGLREIRAWSQVFADDIKRHTANWNDLLEQEAEKHAAQADATGAALARAWLALL